MTVGDQRQRGGGALGDLALRLRKARGEADAMGLRLGVLPATLRLDHA